MADQQGSDSSKLPVTRIEQIEPVGQSGWRVWFALAGVSDGPDEPKIAIDVMGLGKDIERAREIAWTQLAKRLGDEVAGIEMLLKTLGR